MDWDTALREVNGRVNALGLYDLDRKPRPVGAAYRDLAAAWSETPLLPNGPLTVLSQWYVAPEGPPRRPRSRRATAQRRDDGAPPRPGRARAGRPRAAPVPAPAAAAHRAGARGR